MNKSMTGDDAVVREWDLGNWNGRLYTLETEHNAAIRQQAAEIERLTVSREDWKAKAKETLFSLQAANGLLEASEARTADLLKALERYGKHESYCAAGQKDGCDCSCGFLEAIAPRDTGPTVPSSPDTAWLFLAPRVGDARTVYVKHKYPQCAVWQRGATEETSCTCGGLQEAYDEIAAPPAASAEREELAGLIHEKENCRQCLMAADRILAAGYRKRAAQGVGEFAAELVKFYESRGAKYIPAQFVAAHIRGRLSALPKGQEHEG